MKKRNVFVFIALWAAFGTQAAIREEWTFEADAAGSLLSAAVNSGADGAAFEPGGAGVLEADGFGLLLSTPSAAGAWENGADLDANIVDASSGIRYLRYDLKYDVSTDNTVGASIGISFVDNTGTNISGLVVAYDPDGAMGAPSGKVMNPVSEVLAQAGTISAIAKVDLDASSMTIWYDLTGANSFDESSPASIDEISISSINDLRIQATGEASPAGSDDFVAVENIRIADSWAEITEPLQLRFLVSPAAITLRVAPGETGSASVTMSNFQGAGTPFSVRDDGRRPSGYAVEIQSQSREFFRPADYQPATVFSVWNGLETDPMDIGFNFTLFETEYNEFSVSQNGFLTLISTLLTNEIPSAKVMPFETAIAVDQATIRYKKRADQLIVAWGNGTGQEFQAFLHADGTIEYLYESGTWGAGEIGLQGDKDQVISHIPGQTGKDSLLLTSGASWITYDPVSGNISGGGGTQKLTFSADAPADEALGSTYNFITTVDWGGGSEVINVTVMVALENRQLDLPAAFTFSGSAGSISSAATMTVSNNTDVSIAYSIVDAGAQDAGYAFESVDYQWSHIPEVANYIIDESELDTEPVMIGFPFILNGNTYTSLLVGVGGLTLGSEMVTAFNVDLLRDENTSIRAATDIGRTRFTVTWENIAVVGESQDQTFQVVLFRDGSIRYNYRFIESESLEPTGEPLFEKVYTIGNVSFVTEAEMPASIDVETNQIFSLARASFSGTPVQSKIITFSPTFGVIPAGETADISLIGDARSLTGGGTNDVEVSTRLIFTHGDNAPSVDVTFIATNSVETTYPAEAAIAASMWGTDEVAVVSSKTDADGSRALSWPAPDDPLSRTYIVWYTTSLSHPWTTLAVVPNQISYVDTAHNDEPVVFYKVTVQ